MPKKTQTKPKVKKPEIAKSEPAQQAIPLVKDFNDKKEIKKNMKKKILLGFSIVLTILLGVGTGYVLALKKTGSLDYLKEAGLKRQLEEGAKIGKGTKVGVADEKTFRDNAEGKLEKGGVNGEGSHRLIRPGGESQNVYLTSSVIDLDQFVGRKVKVWGETFAAQKAGWLMDVGKLEVLE